jgi:hypothetical protein
MCFSGLQEQIEAALSAVLAHMKIPEEYSGTVQQGQDTFALREPVRDDSLFATNRAENSGKWRRNLDSQGFEGSAPSKVRFPENSRLLPEMFVVCSHSLIQLNNHWSVSVVYHDSRSVDSNSL